ncbi:MAG: hypothetical protein ACI9YH_002976 [Colwellia sp.]|jgi:hypothetical protein
MNRIKKAKHIAIQYQMRLTVHHEYLASSGYALRFFFEDGLKKFSPSQLWRDTSYEEFLAGGRAPNRNKLAIIKNKLRDKHYRNLGHPFWKVISESLENSHLQTEVYEKLPAKIQQSVSQIRINATQKNASFEEFYHELKTIEQETSLDALTALLGLIRQYRDFLTPIPFNCLCEFSYRLFNRLLVLTDLHLIAPELFCYIQTYIFEETPQHADYQSPWLEGNTNWIDDYYGLMRAFYLIYRKNDLKEEWKINSTCYWITYSNIKYLTFELDNHMAIKSNGELSGAFQRIDYFSKEYPVTE